MSCGSNPTQDKPVSVRPKVVVYVKSGYAPCLQAVSTVERVREQIPFDLEQIDVIEDTELSKKYVNDVPVVTINGKEAFRGTVSEGALKRRLKKAKTKTADSTKPTEVAVSTSSKASTSSKSSGPVVGPTGSDAGEGIDRKWLPAMAAFMVAVLIGAGYFVREGFAEAAVGKGRLARTLLRVEQRQEAPPSFALDSLVGQRVTSDERFRGRVVFINFWATWCPPCVEEMPSMLRLREKMNNDPRFDMLAISTDEDWPVVKKFFDAPPPFEVLLDKEGKIAREYGTEKFPETYIVVDGRLIGYIIGPRDWDTWYAEAYLRALSEHGLEL